MHQDSGEEEGLKDNRSFAKHPPVDQDDIAAHHTERWQNQAMYVGLHFASNPNRPKRGRHRKHHRKHHSDRDKDGNDHETSKPPTPPSQRVQFILGQEDQDEDHMSHDIFCEMEELRPVGDEGTVEWKECARWIKFEEDVEEGGERWSKPHVATLSLHSLFELRKGILSGTVMLDLDATNIMQITELVLDNMVASKQLEDEHRERVQEVLLSRHRHQHEKDKKGISIVRSLADIGKNRSSKGLEEKDGNGKNSAMGSKRGSSKDFNDSRNESGADLTQAPSTQKRNDSIFDMNHVNYMGDRKMSIIDRLMNLGSNQDDQDTGPCFNEHFLKKIPAGAEASNVLVGEVDFLTHPIIAFVRLSKAHMLGDLTEVPVPTRFIFILLGPQGNQSRYHEIGRSIATLMSDEVFHDVAYKAKDRGDLLAGIDEFLDQVTVLPPGEWDPTIRIEPPKSVPSQEGRKHKEGSGLPNGTAGAGGEDGDGEGHDDEHGGSTLVRTGRIFGGLRADIKRKIPFYLSDYKDVLHVQCIASVFFMYFACLTPIITFGGLLGSATDDNMAAIESLLAGAICGISYHLFSGQPLTIIGSTGPVLVFETIVYNFSHDNNLDYLGLRFWIGLWVSLILVIIVAFDMSALVRYITRFTEESFACLIALIFIYEAFKKLIHILDHDGVYRQYNPLNPPDFYCECVPKNTSSANATVNAMLTTASPNATATDWVTRDEKECDKLGGELVGMGCTKIPDVFFWSCLLFLGTFTISYSLKYFRNSRFFPSKVRGIISDFAVMIAIVTMVLTDALVHLHTPKLNVPVEFKPTRDDRGWVINPFKNPVWCAFAALAPALLATILIFMDQQITAVIVNRKENKLKKGNGYHLDLFIIAIQIGVCSVLGLPWFVAATVLSINHVRSLTVESESAAPGEKPRFLGIREQRMTGIIVFLMVGVSVLLTKMLQVIPMPVLYGVFLFMGVSSLNGVQLMQRISIMFMPPKYQPDYIYLRHVPLRRCHLFTAIQVLCLACLWVIKMIKSISIVFPLMVLAMCFVRKGLDWVFTRHELTWLDDIMPESHKKEKEEKKKKQLDEEGDKAIDDGGKPQNTIEMTGGAISIPLQDGKSINIPVDRITYDPESGQVNISEEMGKTAIWKQLAANESDPNFQIRNRKGKNSKHKDKHHHKDNHHKDSLIKEALPEKPVTPTSADPTKPVKFSIDGGSSDENLESPQIVIDPPSKHGTPENRSHDGSQEEQPPPYEHATNDSVA